MPGIYVRSIGRFDWENQNKEPILTVPGSYWLCHKNNIYKFTFKFNKSIRPTIEFAYSKELMKIIRRVIKWQPKQGQHFSSKNLFVTYNHASWTRQDKTFAEMKFCNRPDAAAFPHAFILTIKILDQQSNFEMGARGSKPDVEKSLMCSVDSNLLLSNGTSCENKSRDHKDIIFPNDEKDKEDRNFKDLSCTLQSGSLLIESPDSPIIASTTFRSQESEEKVDNDSSSTESTNQNIPTCDSPEEIGEEPKVFTNSVNELNSEKVNNSDAEDESDCSSDSQSDSASLPYQYLIEKDIERTLENFRLAELEKSRSQEELQSPSPVPSPVSLTDSMFVKNDIENHCFESRIDQKSNSNSHGKLRSRQNSRDSDSLPPPEVANLKSSDITDLVMKGLMFTIRQDEDTVTVVEQKTKLEVDEVLENSEKVETKAGDSCLLNSSLLRLEKMVTRIKEPVCLPEHMSNEVNPFVSYMDQCNMEVDPESVQKIEQNLCDNKSIEHSISDIYDDVDDLVEAELRKSSYGLGFTTNFESSDEEIELRLSESEEEEDIVPEALVNSSISSETAYSKESQDQELISKAMVDKNSLSTEPLHCVAESESISSSKNSAQLPKMISNTLVTNDQLPPLLQKVIQNKFLVNKSYCQSSVNKETDENEQDNVNSDNIVEEVKEISTNNNLDNFIDVDLDIHTDVDVNIDIGIEKDTLETSGIQELSHSNNTNCESNYKFDAISETEETINSVNVIDEYEDTSKSSSSISKSTEISCSDSDFVSKLPRRTRSTSKSYFLRNNVTAEHIPNNRQTKMECQIKTRSQRLFEKSFSNQSNNKTSVQQKRKNSTSDKSISKVHKSSNGMNGYKDVNINMNKLLSDLKYGVRVAIERLDIQKVHR